MKIRVVGALCAMPVVVQVPPSWSQSQGIGILALPRALHKAATKSTRLAAADRTIAMSDRRREQANALPNPVVGFEVDNFASGVDFVVHGVEIIHQFIHRPASSGLNATTRMKAPLASASSSPYEMMCGASPLTSGGR